MSSKIGPPGAYDGCRYDQFHESLVGYCSEANLKVLENRGIVCGDRPRSRRTVAGTIKGVATAPAPTPQAVGAPTRVETMRGRSRPTGMRAPTGCAGNVSVMTRAR
jgi:hypothetical protein